MKKHFNKDKQDKKKKLFNQEVIQKNESDGDNENTSE